jgi:hypothetical protein
MNKREARMKALEIAGNAIMAVSSTSSIFRAYDSYNEVQKIEIELKKIAESLIKKAERLRG